MSDSPSPDPLSAALDAAWTAGQQAWPRVALARSQFDAHVRRLAAPPEAVVRHGSDLFLAAACAASDPVALAHFEATLMPVALDALSRLRMPADVRDDVCQGTRIRLLVGPDPKIELYAGGGPLAAWVRVAALRAGLNVLETLRRPLQATSRDEEIDGLLAREPGPEIDATRRLDGASFRQALERSFDRLSAREKTLLRMHFVDDLGIDAIGLVYRVHRATAARWLVALRKRLFEELRRDLAIELRAGSSDVRSLMALFDGEIRLSLERILPATPPVNEAGAPDPAPDPISGRGKG